MRFGYGLGAMAIVRLWFRFGVVGSNRNQTTAIPKHECKRLIIQIFAIPRTVEEILARRDSARDRWIRSFDVQAKSFQDSETSNSQPRYY